MFLNIGTLEQSDRTSKDNLSDKPSYFAKYPPPLYKYISHSHMLRFLSVNHSPPLYDNILYAKVKITYCTHKVKRLFFKQMWGISLQATPEYFPTQYPLVLWNNVAG